MTNQPWNQKFADDGYCPYCGTINWERDIDFDWEHSRQECKCELCGAEWWELLVPTPKSPSPVMEPTTTNLPVAGSDQYLAIGIESGEWSDGIFTWSIHIESTDPQVVADCLYAQQASCDEEIDTGIWPEQILLIGYCPDTDVFRVIEHWNEGKEYREKEAGEWVKKLWKKGYNND